MLFKFGVQAPCRGHGCATDKICVFQKHACAPVIAFVDFYRRLSPLGKKFQRLLQRRDSGQKCARASESHFSQTSTADDFVGVHCELKKWQTLGLLNTGDSTSLVE